MFGTTLQFQGKEPGQRNTKNNHDRLGGILHMKIYLQTKPCNLPEETRVKLMCAVSYGYGTGTWILTNQVQNKLASAQNKTERRMLNITHKNRKPNVWVWERTHVIYIISKVRIS